MSVLTNSNLSGSAAISNANLANPTTTLGNSTLTLGELRSQERIKSLSLNLDSSIS